jgi:hypothetical protein
MPPNLVYGVLSFLPHYGLGITGVHNKFVSSQHGVTATAIDASIYAIHIRITKISTFPICPPTHRQRKRIAEYVK